MPKKNMQRYRVSHNVQMWRSPPSSHVRRNGGASASLIVDIRVCIVQAWFIFENHPVCFFLCSFTTITYTFCSPYPSIVMSSLNKSHRKSTLPATVSRSKGDTSDKSTKRTVAPRAARDIDLSENPQNIVPNRTRTVKKGGKKQISMSKPLLTPRTSSLTPCSCR